MIHHSLSTFSKQKNVSYTTLKKRMTIKSIFLWQCIAVRTRAAFGEHSTAGHHLGDGPDMLEGQVDSDVKTKKSLYAIKSTQGILAGDV